MIISKKVWSCGIYSTQDWVSLPSVLLVASGGIHVWHMHALTEIFGDDSVLQFGGGTLGHPWGNALGAVANWIALEAHVQAHNEGRDLTCQGNDIICEATKWTPELVAACEVWIGYWKGIFPQKNQTWIFFFRPTHVMYPASLIHFKWYKLKQIKEFFYLLNKTSFISIVSSWSKTIYEFLHKNQYIFGQFYSP